MRESFRRRTRPGWTRPSENEPVPIKRLRGLDEFVRPDFVGRMARVVRRRKMQWYAALIFVIALGAWIGWFLL